MKSLCNAILMLSAIALAAMLGLSLAWLAWQLSFYIK